MGKKSSRKKDPAMLDSDDTASVSSTTSTMRSENMGLSGYDVVEVEVDQESLLDRCVDALYEKRGSTREQALASIIDSFNKSLQREFVEKKFATLLQLCLNSVKKGSAKEVALASHVIGLLSLTTGPGEKAEEILHDSMTPISDVLKKNRSDTIKISSLLECLAIITFVGGEEPEQTESSMQIMWQVVRPKLGPNVATAKPSTSMIAMAVSSWSFLLSTMDGRSLDSKCWLESLSHFCTLLEKEDRSLRIAVGEAIALIFETGSLEKFCGDPKTLGDSSSDEGHENRKLMYIQGLKSKILNQVKDLSAEAGGKGSAKKDLNSQRNTFRDILDFLDDGYTPETSMKIGGELLSTSAWAQLIQLSFFKHFLGGGFVKHMQENQFLQDVFGFKPKEKLSGANHRMSEGEKRMFKSQNSALNKARTQFRNKQRMISQVCSQDKNAGHFGVGSGED